MKKILLVYPSLKLIETLSSLIISKEKDQKDMLTHLERFKSERNIVNSLFGNELIDAHVKRAHEYLNLPIGDLVALEKPERNSKILPWKYYGY